MKLWSISAEASYRDSIGKLGDCPAFFKSSLPNVIAFEINFVKLAPSNADESTNVLWKYKCFIYNLGPLYIIHNY